MSSKVWCRDMHYAPDYLLVCAQVRCGPPSPPRLPPAFFSSLHFLLFLHLSFSIVAYGIFPLCPSYINLSARLSVSSVFLPPLRTRSVSRDCFSLPLECRVKYVPPVFSARSAKCVRRAPRRVTIGVVCFIGPIFYLNLKCTRHDFFCLLDTKYSTAKHHRPGPPSISRPLGLAPILGSIFVSSATLL